MYDTRASTAVSVTVRQDRTLHGRVRLTRESSSAPRRQNVRSPGASVVLPGPSSLPHFLRQTALSMVALIMPGTLALADILGRSPGRWFGCPRRAVTHPENESQSYDDDQTHAWLTTHPILRRLVARRLHEAYLSRSALLVRTLRAPNGSPQRRQQRAGASPPITTRPSINAVYAASPNGIAPPRNASHGHSQLCFIQYALPSTPGRASSSDNDVAANRRRDPFCVHSCRYCRGHDTEEPRHRLSQVA